ncbi:MAG: LPS assembly protein LptD [Opitutaceae bacterium]|jgi:LPS-assembly protein|nr:LPS assembly protein LptD [Opitutaceae bacterium]
MPRLLRRLLFALSALAAARAPAAVTLPADDIEITAARTEVTAAGVVYSGGARLRHGDALLLADEIVYEPEGRRAVARGNASLTTGPRRLTASKVTYDLVPRVFLVEDFRLGQSPFLVSGRDASGNGRLMTVRDARVTYTEPSWFAPVVTAERVLFDAENRTARAEGARAGIGALAPLPLPAFAQPVDRFWFTEAEARVGLGSRLGAWFDAGALAPVAPDIGLGGSLGAYTRRGVLLGPAAGYGRRGGAFHGRFSAAHIHDGGDLGEDIAGAAVPKDRWFATWEHRQLAGDGLTLAAFVNHWSDSEVTRDFRRRVFGDLQTPDNFLEATLSRPAYALSVFARFQTNPVYVVQQRLPEARFDLLPRELALGVRHRLNASVAFLRDNSLPSPEERRTGRVDAYYGLSRTFAAGDWLAFTPVAGARGTYYTDANAAGGRSDYARALGQIGFDAELRASATGNYTNAKWGLNGLRHLVTPRVSYRYIPGADKGAPDIPRVDREVFATYLETLDLGDRRDIDAMRPVNTARLSLENILQTRDDTYGSRDLAALTLAADWHFDRDGGRRAFEDARAGLRLTPARWLSLDFYQNVSAHDGNLNELNAALTIRDGRKWELRFWSGYLRDGYTPGEPSQEYAADFQWRLNEVLQLALRVRYDATRSRLTEQTYMLRQNLGNLWTLGYYVSLRKGDSREGSVSLGTRVELARW